MTAALFHRGTLRVSCNNACHRARGSAGGEDYATGVGTPVYAPFDGTYRFRTAGTGGYTMTGISSEVAGAVAECMHMSSGVLPLNGRSAFFRKDTLIGRSGGRRGAPGAGSSTGPHMHEHGIIAGVRQGMSTFIAAYNRRVRPASSGGGATLITKRKVRNVILFQGREAGDKVDVLIVAAPGGAWDRYANTKAQRAALISQFGNPIVLSTQSLDYRRTVTYAARPGTPGDASIDAAALAVAIDKLLAPRLEAIRVLLAGIRGLFK